VKPDNARALMSQPDIDGALVGGASLDPRSFARIVLAACDDQEVAIQRPNSLRSSIDLEIGSCGHPSVWGSIASTRICFKYQRSSIFLRRDNLEALPQFPDAS